jgi:hypothetical protein
MPGLGLLRSKVMLSALAIEEKPRVMTAKIASETAILRKLNLGDMVKAPSLLVFEDDLPVIK